MTLVESSEQRPRGESRQPSTKDNSKKKRKRRISMTIFIVAHILGAIRLLLEEQAFAESVKAMLQTDFEHSRLASAAEYSNRSLPFRFSVRLARLFAPIQ